MDGRVHRGKDRPLKISRRHSDYIIDARDSKEPIRAIQFDWQSPDGASQAQVSIEASDDLGEVHGSRCELRATNIGTILAIRMAA